MTPPNPIPRSPALRRWLTDRVRQHVTPRTRSAIHAESVRQEEAYRHLKLDLIKTYSGGRGFPFELPYTDTVVHSPTEADIDHLVPLRAALDAGASHWDKAAWRRFQSDPANLVLASPPVNREDKGPRGIDQWLPPRHVAWYVTSYCLVKLAYNLTFDLAEVRAAEHVYAAEQ